MKEQKGVRKYSYWEKYSNTLLLRYVLNEFSYFNNTVVSKIMRYVFKTAIHVTY